MMCFAFTAFYFVLCLLLLHPGTGLRLQKTLAVAWGAGALELKPRENAYLPVMLLHTVCHSGGVTLEPPNRGASQHDVPATAAHQTKQRHSPDTGVNTRTHIHTSYRHSACRCGGMARNGGSTREIWHLCCKAPGEDIYAACTVSTQHRGRQLKAPTHSQTLFAGRSSRGGLGHDNDSGCQHGDHHAHKEGQEWYAAIGILRVVPWFDGLHLLLLNLHKHGGAARGQQRQRQWAADTHQQVTRGAHNPDTTCTQQAGPYASARCLQGWLLCVEGLKQSPACARQAVPVTALTQVLKKSREVPPILRRSALHTTAAEESQCTCLDGCAGFWLRRRPTKLAAAGGGGAAATHWYCSRVILPCRSRRSSTTLSVSVKCYSSMHPVSPPRPRTPATHTHIGAALAVLGFVQQVCVLLAAGLCKVKCADGLAEEALLFPGPATSSGKDRAWQW